MSIALRCLVCVLVAAIPFSGCRDKAGAPPNKVPQQIIAPVNAANDASDTASSQTPSICSLPPTLERYNETMNVWKAGPHPASMAKLWKLSDSASSELMRDIDCLSESDFHLAETTFAGYILARDEQYLADPNYEFFRDQADSFGTVNDKAFFTFAHQFLYRKYAWVWEEQNSDVDWCTRLSAPAIVDGYLKAESLMATQAPEYGWWLESRLRGLDTTLRAENCVCDSRDEAVQGLTGSIERVPVGHPLRATLEAVLASVRRKDSKMRFKCHLE